MIGSAALAALRATAATTENLMSASLGVPARVSRPAEWAQALRDTFGEYRAPGVAGVTGVFDGGESLNVVREGRAGDR